MIHPHFEQFTKCPENQDCVTMVTLIHPSFGTVQLFLPLEDFQSNLMGAIRGAWANGATILIQPLEG